MSPDQDQAADRQEGQGMVPKHTGLEEEIPNGYTQELLGIFDVQGPESSSAADQGGRHKAVFQALKDIIARVTHTAQPVQNCRLTSLLRSSFSSL